ncbi:hypothetical protein D3C83_199650 [compost metagenome]
MARIDEQFGYPLVGVAEEQHAASRLPVTPGASDLLVIRFQRIRDIRVNDEANV